MHQLAGRHLQARCPDVGGRDAASSQWCSPAAVQRCRGSCWRQRSPYKLHVSCPAVEQDTEVASTSGRPHSDSELIHSLLAQEQAAVMGVLEGQQQQPEQPDMQKELIQRIKLSGSLSLLCELVQEEAHHFDHKVTSAALYRLSILCHAYFTQLQSAHLTSQEAQQAAWVKYVDPALKALGQLLLQHMDSCDTYTVSISLWAYGHLQYAEEPVLAALSTRGMQLLHDFNSIDCAAALVGLAKHTGPRPRSQREFVEQLMHHTHALLAHVDEWAPRDIISIVWALSQLGAAGPARRPLLQGLVEMSSWRLHEFGVRELVITAYSLGRLRMRLPPQMVKLTNQIMRRLDELNPQDAANLVYACAKVQFKQPELLQKLPDVVLPQLNSFKPQEISNLVYGYGQLHFLHPRLLDAVAEAAAPRLQEFSMQDLCMTLWAYGAVGYCPADTALFEAACRVLLARKERLLPLQITCVVKGFSRAGYQPPAAFMQVMSALAQVKLSQFSPLEYSQLLWAYSTAGYRDVALFEAVVGHAIQQLHSKTHLVTKTTVDTMLAACQGVGFWPQLLVDTAEMRGLYVKTQQKVQEDGGSQAMEPLAPAAQQQQGAAAGAVGAAAQAAAAATAEALAAAGDGQDAAGVAGVASSGGAWEAQRSSSGGGSSSSAMLSAVADAFAADAAGVPGSGPPVVQPGPQPEVFFSGEQLQQQVYPAAARQASRLDSYGLQRPLRPQQQQQQQQQQPRQQEQALPPVQMHAEQQQQQQQQQQQEQEQEGLDHPLLRSQLLPAPTLPQQQQQPRSHSPLPAAAIGGVAYSNGTTSPAQHIPNHSSQDSSNSSSGLTPGHQQPEGDTLVHPVEQQL